MSFQKISSIVLGKDAGLPQVVIAINKITSYLDQHIQNFVGKPQCSSIILPSTYVDLGINTIKHTLNKNITGYRIINQDQISQFCNAVAQVSNPQNNLYLYLYASAPCNVIIEVF